MRAGPKNIKEEKTVDLFMEKLIRQQKIQNFALISAEVHEGENIQQTSDQFLTKLIRAMKKK